MGTLSSVLDQVFAEGLPALARYSDMDPCDWNSKVWCDLEEDIGRFYHSYLRSLVQDPHLERDSDDIPYSVPLTGAPPFGTSVTLGAINQRGLFRQNGRATLLEPCGQFSPRTTETGRHDALHHVYMHLVQKAESINQLFLGTTSLSTLAVIFGEEGRPHVEISDDRLHATVHVSSELVDLVTTQDVRNLWKEAIARVLTELDAARVLESVRHKGRLPPELTSLVEPAHQPDKWDSLGVIRRWPELFSQWLSIYSDQDAHPQVREGSWRPVALRNIEQAGTQFGNWLWSIAWLMFYCQEEVAGRFFYTVRLPHVIKKPERVLPESSLSIVCKRRLKDTEVGRFKEIFTLFDRSIEFAKLRQIAETSITKFRKQRFGLIPKMDKATVVHKPLRSVLEKLYPGGDLPVDFERLCFFLNLARGLVGRRHEGAPLRFCLIHGFGYDRVDAESNGVLEEFRAPLRPRWLRFLEQAKEAFDARDQTEEIGCSLNDWIKSNDLQLQRPDVALYFEEDAEAEYPLPTSLVQVRRLSRREVHPVGTELELRQALRDLTGDSHRTVAVLTGPSGLFVFILGKCLLVRCSGREDWNDPLHLHKTDDDVVLEDQITADLEKIFRSVFEDRSEVAGMAAEMVRHLCEALVSLGHGAMLVVRPREHGEGPARLHPLNPVWLLRPTVQNIDDLKHECTVFALMAALDGATELLLPPTRDEAIQFCCRRFAQTAPEDWVWVDDQDEAGAVLLANGMDRSLWRVLVGKGTRHHTALVLSRRLRDALIITVSADGPVTLYRDGAIEEPKSKISIRFAP